jgi:hypothetical protein
LRRARRRRLASSVNIPLPHVGRYGGHNVLLVQNGIDFGGALRLDWDNAIAQHFILGDATHLLVKLGVDRFFCIALYDNVRRG